VLLAPGLSLLVGAAGAENPAPTSQAHRRSLALPGRVTPPAFSPDGRLIGTVGTDGAIRLWDVATAEPAGPPLELGHEVTTGIWHGDTRGQLLFSPDGKSLAWWFQDKTVVWDLATRQVIGRPGGAGSRLLKGIAARSVVGFSPDGQVLLLETRDGFVFWSITKRAPAGPPLQGVQGGTPFPMEDPPSGIRFSPDGRLAAVPTKDGITLWDVAKGEPTGPPLSAPDSLKEPAVRLAFSPNGSVLAVVVWNKVVLWDVAKGKVAGSLERGGGGASKFFWGAESHIAFSTDGRVLAWVTNHGHDSNSGEILVWDLVGQKPLFPPLDAHRTAATVEFSPDGKTMASQGRDRTVVLWETASGRAIEDPLLIGGKKRPNEFAGKPAFSANGEILMVGAGGFLELWDLVRRPPQLLRRFDHLGRIRRLSPDGHTLALQQDDLLALWDLSSRPALDEPVIVPGFDGDKIAFSPDGATLATYKDGKTGTSIVLWDVAAVLSRARDRERD